MHCAVKSSGGYVTDAALIRGTVELLLAFVIQPALAYPIQLVAVSPNPDAAGQYMASILSESSEAALARYGLTQPQAATARARARALPRYALARGGRRPACDRCRDRRGRLRRVARSC